jgi:hypothetical protein
MTLQRFLAGSAIAACVGLTAVAQASAANLVALTGDSTLLSIDASPAVVRRVNVSGIDAPLLGIDVRPSDGRLYGLLANGKVVTVNLRTGVAAPQVTLSLASPLPADQRFSVDFNPVPDLLRIVSSGGAAAVNLAANVATGAVVVGTAPAYPAPPAPPNPFGGVTPSVTALAYTNGAGAAGTLLFDIDDATDALYVQQPPAAGTLVNVGGQLGIGLGTIGFDIRPMEQGRNRAFLIRGNLLYHPDLLSGRAGSGTRIRGLTSPVRDLAVLPLR